MGSLSSLSSHYSSYLIVFGRRGVLTRTWFIRLWFCGDKEATNGARTQELIKIPNISLDLKVK